MYSTYFQEWLSETYKPCILVFTSENAKKSFALNNLSPADFLRPLGDFTGKKLEPPFAEKENIHISNFHLDFYDNEKFKPIEKNKIQNYINTMFMTNIPHWDLSCSTISKKEKNIEQYLSSFKYYSSPYFIEYEKTLNECLYFDEYELYQQPLLNILICSIEDPPSIISETLCKGDNVPKLIFERKYTVPEENLIIILCDGSKYSVTEEEKLRKIANFQINFSNYYIINWDINNNNDKENDNNNKEISEMYKKYFHKLDLYNPDSDAYRNKLISYGSFISKNDLNKYKEDFYIYFNNFLSVTLPKQINKYLEIIQNNSRLKSFFNYITRKEEINYYPNSNIYKYTDLERAYYNLALINFFFHNYHTAYEYFKILSGCLKDKSPRHKEPLKELITICKYIISYTKKQFNFVNEIIIEGTYEQMIRNELIILKMFENNETFVPMVENIILFIFATKKKFVDDQQLICFNYFYPLLYEKIAVYQLSHNNFRKFAMFMAFSGDSFELLQSEMQIYSLNNLVNLLSVINEANFSFVNFKLFYNNKLGEICKNFKYYEGSFNFFKNCLEILRNFEKNEEVEKSYLKKYLDTISEIKKNNIECKNVNINSLEIPQIDNRSIFLLEENDYKIKQIEDEIKNSSSNKLDTKSWLVFNIYAKKLIKNTYVNLDENDLLSIKMLYDLNNRSLTDMIDIKKRNVHGNINQKIYIKFNITNPLNIQLDITSLKLICDFTPIDSNNDNTQINNYIKYSEEKLILNPNENKNILLNVESGIPGKLTLQGLHIILFNECNLVHYFNKKTSNNLYYYRPKYIVTFLDEDTYQKLQATNNNNNINFKSKLRKLSFSSRKRSSIYKKRTLIYEIRDYNNDLYISLPLSNEIDIYLYQYFLIPIKIVNNSKSYKVKRFTIFLENSDDEKIKTFFKFITKNIKLNENHNTEIIYIPVIPICLGELYIKIIVKFEDEIRIKPIEIKKAIIQINVKESISFEIKENYYNFSLDKNNNYNILNFSLKTDLYIKNNTKLNSLILDENFIINKNKYNLISTNNYLCNENEIHKKFLFQKIYDVTTNNNFDFNNFEFLFNNKEDTSNNHIKEKFDKLINNNQYSNIIFFPWTCVESNNNQKKINGLFPYEIKLKMNQPSKNILRDLFYKSTKAEIKKSKFNNQTLVSIEIRLDKSELITFNNVIDKYDIFANKINPEIDWIGAEKYTVINKLDDETGNNIFTCKFHFLTKLKGLIEVNKIAVLLYKKIEGMNESIGVMQINHITKPLSIII